MHRSFVLTDELLADHRGGQVVALSAHAFGRSYAFSPQRRRSFELLSSFHASGPLVPPVPGPEAGDGPASNPPTVVEAGMGVAMMDVEGVLEARSAAYACGFSLGYDTIRETLAAALDDDRVGAVVMKFASPGGDASRLEEESARMAAMVSASGKDVFGYVDEDAESAAYWIAAVVCTGGIFTPPAGQIGCIGTRCAHVSEAGALEKAGRVVTMFADPPGKIALRSDIPLTELGAERLQAGIVAQTARFYAAVSTARNLTPEMLAALKGATLEGKDAVAQGLADDIATLEQVINLAAARAAATAMTRSFASSGFPAPPKGPVSMSTSSLISLLGLAAGASAHQIEAAAAPLVALGLAAMQLTGQQTAAGAHGVLGAWKSSHHAADGERARLAADAKTAEARERVELVGKLVETGWELPATAWANPETADDVATRTPAPTFAAMDIDALRARVVTLTKQPRSFAGGARTADDKTSAATAAEVLRNAGGPSLDATKIARESGVPLEAAQAAAKLVRGAMAEQQTKG